MPFEMFAFFLLPLVVASGSAMICYVLMNARMEVAVSREKVRQAETEARLRMLEESLPMRVQMAAEAAERRAFDSLMAGFRVEERRFLRDDPQRRTVILRERLYFRNLPLSNWVEQEIPVFDGGVTPIENQSAFVIAQAAVAAKSADAERSVPPGVTSGFPKFLTQ